MMENRHIPTITEIMDRIAVEDKRHSKAMGRAEELLSDFWEKDTAPYAPAPATAGSKVLLLSVAGTILGLSLWVVSRL